MSEIRLNEQAAQILAGKNQQALAKRFALVFLGDTHIGKECKNNIDGSVMYTRLLQSVLRNQTEDKDILAVIHGGDGTHRGGQGLQEFVALTRQVLNWDAPDKDRIPLFMNIGNHEYIDDPAGEYYRKLVADPVPLQRIWFHELKWGVLMLNTGMNDRGHLPGNQFREAIRMIEEEIAGHRGYQVVIDMHIPAAIGPQLFRYLVLNCRYTRQFKQLLRHYPKSIAAVVAHHRHWAKMTSKPYRFRRRTPLFISAYGGHCDCPRFTCLKLTFRHQSDGEWQLSSKLLGL